MCVVLCRVCVSQGFFVDDAIVYCVLGVEVADEAGGSEYKTTKYVFISWVGPNVKPLAKARSSQVRVALYKHTKVQPPPSQPCHVLR